MTLSHNDFVPFGSTITLSAEPASGYYVSAWKGCASTPQNTGDDTDGAAKECEVVPTTDSAPTWGVTFLQQGQGSGTQRIGLAIVQRDCATASGFLDTSAVIGSGGSGEIAVCVFFSDETKTCYALGAGADIGTATLFYFDSERTIDAAHTCDSRHPACGTGMKQRIEDNPLSGCVAEE